LAEFSADECAKFLQFAWARSRLPSEMGTYRMQVYYSCACLFYRSSHIWVVVWLQQINIVEPQDKSMMDVVLPTTETCFFNVNLPRYSHIDIMRSKLKLALLCSTITS
jgi:hypothetical protein